MSFKWDWRQLITLIVISGTSIAIVFIVIAQYHFESWGASKALMRGNVLYCDPTSINVGPIRPGEIKQVRTTVYNLSSSAIKVEGATSFCAERVCIFVNDNYPIVIPRLSKIDLLFNVEGQNSTKGLDGNFSHRINLYISNQVTELQVDGKLTDQEQENILNLLGGRSN